MKPATPSRFSLLSLLGILAMVTATAATHPGCGKEVCQDGTGPLSEVEVTFRGFDLGAAHVLEFDSTVQSDTPPGASEPYRSRRIGRVPFPASARDGSQTFVFDPGWYVRSRAAAAAGYTLSVFIRVYDEQGRMLGEGRYSIDSRADRCHLNRSATVNAGQRCAHKAEGDPCPLQNETLRVCASPDGSGENLECVDSSCGDGYVDRLNGELCEPEVGDPAVLTCGANCLPLPVEQVLWQPGPQWLAVDAPDAPEPREYAAGAYHDGAGAYVLFGGRDADGVARNDTWQFDGAEWTLLDDGTDGPPARSHHAMAYFAQTDQIVLVGGTADASDQPRGQFADLWTWDPASGWQEQSPAGTAPPALHSAPLVYDPGRQEAVLFGGCSASGAELQGTYVLRWLDGTSAWEWEQIATTPTPAGRFGHSFTWLPLTDGDAAVMVGGQGDYSGASSKKEIWIYHGGSGLAWKKVDDTLSLNNPTRHQVIPLSGTTQALVVGGTRTGSPPHRPADTTWLWDYAALADSEGSWTEQELINRPSALTGHLGFALPDGTAYVFGGRVPPGTSDSPARLTNRTWLYHPDEGATPAAVLGPASLWFNYENETTTSGYYALSSGEAHTMVPNRVATLLSADFDGDGRQELAVGLPGGMSDPTDPETQIGKVLLTDTPFIGDKEVAQDKPAWRAFWGPPETRAQPWGSWFGGAQAAGDINGDGTADLVVGAPFRTDGGALYLFMGGNTSDRNPMGAIPISGDQSPLRAEFSEDAKRHYKLLAELEENDELPTNDRLGYAVAVGDFDGDGRADFAAGAPLRSALASEAGAVYAFPGAQVRDLSPGDQDQSITKASSVPFVTLRAHTAGLRLGVAVTAGDVNGDGYDDLVVGTAPVVAAGCSPPACGALAVLWGGPDFFALGAQELESLTAPAGALVTAEGGGPYAGLGARVAVVDLDQDAHGEVATSLGAPDELAGTPRGVLLLRGQGFQPTFAAETDVAGAISLLVHDAAGEASGLGLHLSRGDVNGDRRPDLIIGAPFAPLRRGDLSGRYPGDLITPHAGALHVLLSSRLSTLWSVNAEQRVTLAELGALTATDPVPLPWLTVRGGRTDGFLGVSATTHSHLTPQIPLDAPHAITLVTEPGWFNVTRNYGARWRGRVHSFLLQDLLPCGPRDRCSADAL